MSEMKLLTDSAKDKLYTNLLHSIDQEFGAEALTPPPTNPELVEGWCVRAALAIKKKIISWEEFFAMFPPDIAEAIKAKLRKAIDEKQRIDREK